MEIVLQILIAAALIALIYVSFVSAENARKNQEKAEKLEQENMDQQEQIEMISKVAQTSLAAAQKIRDEQAYNYSTIWSYPLYHRRRFGYPGYNRDGRRSHHDTKDDNQNITINLNDGTVEETTTP